MLIEAEGVIAFVLFALWIWALIDCISTDSELIRNLPKGVWLIIVIILFDLGAILWLLLGRPANKHWRPATSPGDYSAPRRPRGVEDGPHFVAGEVSDRRSKELDRRLAAWEATQPAAEITASDDQSTPSTSHDPGLDQWESDLAEREVALRRRELELRERELEARARDLDNDR